MADSSPLAIPHKDLLVGVLEPFAEAAVAAEAKAEPVVVVAATILPLVDAAEQTQHCCQLEVVHFC